MGPKVTIIGGGSSSFVPVADPPPHAVGGARGRARLAHGHRRGPPGRDAGAGRQADRERGQRHPRHEHARPARGARRRRLRDRGHRRGRHGRLGQRPRDPGPLRHRHADRRLARAGRDHARLPQRAGARSGCPQRRRGRARPVHLQLHEPRADRGARDAHRRAGRQVVRALLLRCACEQPRVAGARRRASSPSRSRCRRSSPASTTAPRSSRCASSTARTPCRSYSSARPAGRQLGARDLRRAALLLDALDGVLPADAAPRGALLGHRPGREDALRHHDARHGLRARARGTTGRARSDVDGPRRRRR